MTRILIGGCEQEISSFNPVPSTYADWDVDRGDHILEANRGKATTIWGAMQEFDRWGDVELVASYQAVACAAGPLAQKDFERIASEFLDSIRPHAGKVDGVYFSLHGSMGATDELDPEGYLLERAREILGEDIPLVISQDLHGVLTEKMLSHIDGVAIYHTYPHVDFEDTGRRAARQLMRILRDGVKPVIARARVPALVRGDELITESGLFGAQVRYAKRLIEEGSALGAGFQIGNPFTDVPELSSQAIVVTDGDEALARRAAEEMAAGFWENRAKMQTKLVGLTEAVAEARAMAGPVIFTDAADAPSSGSTGDSNAILAELARSGYPHTVLAPLTDPPAVKRAFDVGVGGNFRTPLGGTLDSRYTPIELDVTVDMLSRGRYTLESAGTPENSGPTAVLKSGNITLVVTTRPVVLSDRSLFLAHGQDPRAFHSIIVKSPHCQPQYFDDWSQRNFNVDAPGSTSANIKMLGHTVCARPMFPLDEDFEFTPRAQIFRRG